MLARDACDDDSEKSLSSLTNASCSQNASSASAASPTNFCCRCPRVLRSGSTLRDDGAEPARPADDAEEPAPLPLLSPSLRLAREPALADEPPATSSAALSSRRRRLAAGALSIPGVRGKGRKKEGQRFTEERALAGGRAQLMQ